jgi:hypothetical protein
MNFLLYSVADAKSTPLLLLLLLLLLLSAATAACCYCCLLLLLSAAALLFLLLLQKGEVLTGKLDLKRKRPASLWLARC